MGHAVVGGGGDESNETTISDLSRDGGGYLRVEESSSINVAKKAERDVDGIRRPKGD